MSTHDLPEELRDTAQRLRSERPELDAHGLDRVRGRIARRMATPARRSRRSLAITLCLASGLVFSGAGTGLAISGFSSDSSATSAQYSQSTATKQVVGDPTSGVAGTSTSGGDTSGGDTAGTEAARETDSQVVAVGSSKKLPFTGSASLLVLGLGGVLLLTGAVLRRRTTRDDI
jgi:hypothetical protein